MQGLTNSSYRRTLNARDKIEDDHERSEILKACHKRCAERTLKVLEKNGGIFIKLGQHLVRYIQNTMLGDLQANM